MLWEQARRSSRPHDGLAVAAACAVNVSSLDEVTAAGPLGARCLRLPATVGARYDVWFTPGHLGLLVVDILPCSLEPGSCRGR